jgi:hypothetical protein
MKEKHSKDNINEAFMVANGPTVFISIMVSCKIGINAPTTIAITKPAAPSVESYSPRPFSAIP